MEDYTTLIAEANKELTRKHDHPDQWALERLLCAMTGACEELQRELVSLQQVLDSVDRARVQAETEAQDAYAERDRLQERVRELEAQNEQPE